MEIQIEVPHEQTIRNFSEWFREEGFYAFITSKYNILEAAHTDSFITDLSEDKPADGESYNGGHVFVID